MPLYTYHCDDCARDVELLEPMNPDGDTRTCPGCMKDTAKRVMAPATFRLYGDGFYKPNKR